MRPSMPAATSSQAFVWARRCFLSTRGFNKETGEDYTWKIEADNPNILRFRDVNPSGGAVVERTVAQMRRYIKEVKAMKIRGVK
jgi:hypothetical protein